MSEVIKFQRANSDSDLNTSPEVCLKEALQDNLVEVIVIGWNDKDEFYTNTNIAHGETSLWLLEAAKQKLFAAWNSKK